MFRNRYGAAGFTLIEVMVALVIVALGMIAVNSQLNRYALTARYMEEKTLSSWVASNTLTLLSVDPEWPEIGDFDEEVELAGRLWLVTVEVTATEVENLRRVDVDVALTDQPEIILHRSSGFIEPPVPGGFVPVRWASGGAGG